jgi:hypothetical protein
MYDQNKARRVTCSSTLVSGWKSLHPGEVLQVLGQEILQPTCQDATFSRGGQEADSDCTEGRNESVSP